MKKAFTLAETLLVLMIIGVIAAMVIPSLMNNPRNRDNVSRLKKIAGELTTATTLLQLEAGPVDGWDWTSEADIVDLYKKKFKVMKECGMSDGCFPEDTKSLSGSDLNESSGYYKIILADGTSLGIKACNGGCTPGNYGLDSSNELLGLFLVDVNGFRGPNKGGLDTFVFGLVKHKGVQAGGSYSSAGCDQRSSNCLNCAAKVIREDNINYW